MSIARIQAYLDEIASGLSCSALPISYRELLEITGAMSCRVSRGEE